MTDFEYENGQEFSRNFYTNGHSILLLTSIFEMSQNYDESIRFPAFLILSSFFKLLDLEVNNLLFLDFTIQSSAIVRPSYIYFYFLRFN